MTSLDKIAAAAQFARERHAGQKRKGKAGEPYIAHVEEVADLVASFGGDEETIAAAWLHDTIEDCPSTSYEELVQRFGRRIADIVAEVTDDKSREKAERKRLQIEKAPERSQGASLVKIADKTSNLRAIANSPPTNWDFERRMGYVRWAVAVIAHLPVTPKIALDAFLGAVDQAEIAIATDLLPVRHAQEIATAVRKRQQARRKAPESEIERFLLDLLDEAH